MLKKFFNVKLPRLIDSVLPKYVCERQSTMLINGKETIVVDQIYVWFGVEIVSDSYFIEHC